VHAYRALLLPLPQFSYTPVSISLFWLFGFDDVFYFFPTANKSQAAEGFQRVAHLQMERLFFWGHRYYSKEKSKVKSRKKNEMTTSL
jgi:hypothetical protein